MRVNLAAVTKQKGECMSMSGQNGECMSVSEVNVCGWLVIFLFLPCSVSHVLSSTPKVLNLSEDAQTG